MPTETTELEHVLTTAPIYYDGWIIQVEGNRVSVTNGDVGYLAIAADWAYDTPDPFWRDLPDHVLHLVRLIAADVTVLFAAP